MAKNKKTFAQRAKDIVKRYKRADFDPIEKAALDSALTNLQQEQEVYKQDNNIGEYKCGGKMYGFGDPVIDPNLQEFVESQQNINTVPNRETTYEPYSTSIAPSLISGATTALGNVLLAGSPSRTPRISLPRVAQQDVSFEGARQRAMRTAGRGLSGARYASARGARTRGEYMANRAASEAAIATGLGETLSASAQEEALVNANIRAGMNRTNAEIAAKEEIFNAQQRARDIENRNAYLSAAIQTIPQMTRDISAIRAQDNLINLLGDDYGLYMSREPGKLRRKPTVRYRGK